MFLGWSATERGAQMRDLEALLMGYGHAIEMHGVNDPGGTFLPSFGRFLRERFGWSESIGPIGAIRTQATTDEEAWGLLWKLIWEFRSTL